MPVNPLTLTRGQRTMVRVANECKLGKSEYIEKMWLDAETIYEHYGEPPSDDHIFIRLDKKAPYSVQNAGWYKRKDVGLMQHGITMSDGRILTRKDISTEYGLDEGIVGHVYRILKHRPPANIEQILTTIRLEVKGDA